MHKLRIRIYAYDQPAVCLCYCLQVFELGRGIHVSMEKIETLMVEIDKNQDGRISFSEFAQVMVNHNRQREARGETLVHRACA